MVNTIWILKTEPNEFSIDDLRQRGEAGEPWNGIRNYQARNFMREMVIGDVALIYHSACAKPGIVGTGSIIRAAYADAEALDSNSPYYDPKSSTENNRWSLVDVAFQEKWSKPVLLTQLRANPALSDMKLIRQSRLSISPVTKAEYSEILALRA